jgi:hypothetical protein
MCVCIYIYTHTCKYTKDPCTLESDMYVRLCIPEQDLQDVGRAFRQSLVHDVLRAELVDLRGGTKCGLGMYACMCVCT